MISIAVGSSPPLSVDVQASSPIAGQPVAKATCRRKWSLSELARSSVLASLPPSVRSRCKYRILITSSIAPVVRTICFRDLVITADYRPLNRLIYRLDLVLF